MINLEPCIQERERQAKAAKEKEVDWLDPTDDSCRHRPAKSKETPVDSYQL